MGFMFAPRPPEVASFADERDRSIAITAAMTSHIAQEVMDLRERLGKWAEETQPETDDDGNFLLSEDAPIHIVTEAALERRLSLILDWLNGIITSRLFEAVHFVDQYAQFALSEVPRAVELARLNDIFTLPDGDGIPGDSDTSNTHEGGSND